jgi:hypothetical protein
LDAAVESSKKYDLSGVHGAEVFRDLAEGLRVKLTNGAVGEIVGNPHDGAFLLIQFVEHPTEPSKIGEEEAVFYPDVAEVIDPD